MILIRRAVFESIGGYRELRGAAHEDWELQARLAMAGYTIDVLPEYLHFYRVVEDGLARMSADFPAKHRMIETYDRQLASAGLYGMANAMYALYRQWQDSLLQSNRMAEVPAPSEARTGNSEFIFFEAEQNDTHSAAEGISPDHSRSHLLGALPERLARLIRRDRTP
jgi:hypothetical protein